MCFITAIFYNMLYAHTASTNLLFKSVCMQPGMYNNHYKQI